MLPACRYPHILCLTANEKDFSLSLEMTIWGKRHSRIVSLLRGKSVRRHAPPFLWKEGASTRAPSLGRGCRAQRGGVGFLFCGEAASSVPSPCRESCVILVPSSTTNISLTRASQRGVGSILRLFDYHAFMHFPAEIRCIYCLMSFRIAAEGKAALPEVFLFADIAFDRPAIEESTDIEE